MLNALSVEGATTTELADVLGMTKHGAAKVVSGMVGLDLVVVHDHPHDARARMVQLTPRGKDALDAIRRALTRAVDRWSPERPRLRSLR